MISSNNSPHHNQSIGVFLSSSGKIVTIEKWQNCKRQMLYDLSCKI
ncbi:MAG: hypothetical protein ACI4MI_04250 [Christensenellales bacterium]